MSPNPLQQLAVTLSTFEFKTMGKIECPLLKGLPIRRGLAEKYRKPQFRSRQSS